MAELDDQVPQVGIRRETDHPADVDPDFRGIVAAREGTVVDEQGAKTQPRRTDGGTDARDTRPCDDEVIFAALFRDIIARKEFPPERLHVIGRRRGIVGKIKRVAAAVEARQVVQGDSDRAGAARLRASVLPFPFRPPAPDCFRQRDAIQEHLEAPRTLPVIPGRSPVVGTYPYVPNAAGKQRDRPEGIRDRLPQPMRHQVRGSHQIGILGIQHPAAVVPEAFRFD